MPTIEFDMYQTLAIAVIMLFFGIIISKKVPFLAKFCIPAPVIGGLVFAIFTCVCYGLGLVSFTFDDTLRNVCMVFFFTSVGFQANLKVLKKGGVGLFILLILVIGMIFCQNLISIGLSDVLGINRLLGLCTGSIPMIGGHGTAGAFGPVLEDFGVTGATTVCTAAATFGLIAGSLMGGPLATRLIERKKLLLTAESSSLDMAAEEEKIAEILTGADESDQSKKTEIKDKLGNYPQAVFQLVIAAGIGTVVSTLLSMCGLTFPIYIGGLIVGVVIRNLSEYTGLFKVHMEENNNFGSICLSLFLGIAMITLKLWQLADLAIPMLVLLAAQTVFMFLYARFFIFNAMGRDYDAAVITAGTCGFGMGATPNAMANMQAVCNKYVPSVKAFLLIPVVGSLFVDLFNSLIVTGFINAL